MSLLTELQARGVTAEDLEKAAAVRLFEKAAAAEGVDLDDLSEQQVIALFEQFTTPPATEKEASAMNDDVIALFEKTAAAEGIDLDEMSDEDLAELYQHYIENVLPEQVAEADGADKEASNEEVLDLFQKTASAEGIDLDSLSEEDLAALFDHYVENVLPLQLGDENATDKVADAQEKLAEAEILGRHMARAYADEMNKIAADSTESFGSRMKRYAAEASGVADYRRAGGMEGIRAALRKADAAKGETAAGHSAHRKNVAKLLGKGALKGGASLTAAGAAVYGGKKALDKRKASQEKKASFDDVELEALLRIAAEFGYDVAESVIEKNAAEGGSESFTDKLKRGARSIDEKAQSLGRSIASVGAGEYSGPVQEGAESLGKRVRGGVKTHRALGYGAPALATGALALGGKKMMDKRKADQEKKSSADDHEDLVAAVAAKMLVDAGYDV